MKHVMTMALIATAVLAAPAGYADPDPHNPDVGANFCPGGAGVGGQPGQPAEPYCDGVPYADGSYWHAIKRSGTNVVVVQCVKPPPPPGPFSGLLPQLPPGPLPAPPGSCVETAQ
ncbi:hypothetical protein [Candidatus Mycobacterium methanotrophicum]|uniref:Secreted protein n=1 Tax=Candidatus Mycobacterium methanotrophicum TaxID=2943498 RepID=A0ABY4QGI1_9MYCO|nr:hypothetical protein [Candidatus Mycobacterium methanotrophicum]UQX09611.1 hypothetical protein M5I08_14735 [Candidatus Mycobacterium methanotrophicum]